MKNILPRLQIWFEAIRPMTLIASAAPVVLGTAMAFGNGVGHWPSAFAALIGAVLIQIGTNLSNDYYDFKRGADTAERLGPPRAIVQGLVSAQGVKRGFILAFVLAGVVACYLIARGGWPILIIAVVSILSGYFYTAGSKPLAYIGLGDLFVLVFFGPVSVAGAYYVQSLEWSWAAAAAGLAPGLFSVGILDVNNLRDIDSDRKVGKRTLAVRFGRTFACYEYLLCIMAAGFIPVLVHVITGANEWTLLASGIAFLAIPTIHDVLTSQDGRVLNKALERTGLFLLIYTVIYSITWAI